MLAAPLTAHATSPRITRFSVRWVAALVACDVAMFFLSLVVATDIVTHTRYASIDTGRVAVSAVIFIGVWLVIFQRLGLYERSFAMSVKDELYHTTAALCLGMAPQLVLFTIVPSLSTSRLTLTISLGLSILLVGAVRAVAHRLRDVESLRRQTRIAIVGHSTRIDGADEAMRMVPNARIFRLSVNNLDEALPFAAKYGRAAIEGLPWFAQAVAWDCDTLIFTEMIAPEVLPDLLAAGERFGLKIAFAPPRVRCHAYSLTLEVVGEQALIVPKPLRATTLPSRRLKRGFDLALGSFALLVFAPVMAVIALALVLEGAGPVLYKQTRVGRFGRPFQICKFRSMRVDAEAAGAQLATRGDARVTKLGRILRRTSLDELPQIFNVLAGEMSVVGPRPERPVFAEIYRERFARYEERHLVQPGITGWAQVNISRVLAADDIGQKLANDLFYVENWSLFMDVSVIFKTAAEVLFHRAA